ncbi:DNA-directed RNA polymerases 1 and 3 subunit RPAC1 [Coccidioides immitis RMSCC 3703]|uniref:DNA-directed RNA polymerases 1 and 3 subunit RPAC1 n=1 Tax=Coccidioides immitis RMSCC 3703 TaxID=454286 RepID=A0A0J8QJI4_COCIT|nr:DNA-directed RNA polymerases 1 and 3 subunit RPAC1 [Coccidioides immitis RMSCC 3703]
MAPRIASAEEVRKRKIELHKGTQNARPDEDDPTKLYNNAHVYAKDIVFEPVGRQAAFFSGPHGVIQPAYPDILLAKLRPGQKIDIEMHCIKGIGQDHAKFSPVATASYRLLPDIQITRPILGNDAVKFANCFPKGVIGIEQVTAEDAAQAGSGYEGQEGQKKAVVVDPFKDTVSRECLRHEEFKGKVKLGRVRDHFIFNIESVGQFNSDLLFLESVKVLKLKCARLKRNVAALADMTDTHLA